jgi:hypothetical protein
VVKLKYSVDMQDLPCKCSARFDIEETMRVVPCWLMLAGFLFCAFCDKIRADYAG